MCVIFFLILHIEKLSASIETLSCGLDTIELEHIWDRLLKQRSSNDESSMKGAQYVRLGQLAE